MEICIIRQHPQKATNVFPKLDVDLDNDYWPDGFDHDTTAIHGVFDPTDGVSVSNGKCFRIYSGAEFAVSRHLQASKKDLIYFLYTLREKAIQEVK